MPAARRVAVLWDATTSPQQLRALKGAAQAAAMELQVLEIRRPAEDEGALKAAMKGRPHALILLSSPLIRQTSPRVAAFTVKNRLPAISMFRQFAEAEGYPLCRRLLGRPVSEPGTLCHGDGATRGANAAGPC